MHLQFSPSESFVSNIFYRPNRKKANGLEYFSISSKTKQGRQAGMLCWGQNQKLDRTITSDFMGSTTWRMPVEINKLVRVLLVACFFLASYFLVIRKYIYLSNTSTIFCGISLFFFLTKSLHITHRFSLLCGTSQ